MSKGFKVMAIIAVAAMVLAMPAAAQNAVEELGPLESNTYKATSGIFGNDVDNYMDVHAYSDVELEKWFGFLTGKPLYIEGQESIDWIKPEGFLLDKGDDQATPPVYYGPADRKNWQDWQASGKLEDNPVTGLISLGYARKFGSIYLGVWYQGNVVQVTGGNSTKTTSISPTYDAYKELAQTEETTTYNESWINSSNQIEFLVGVAGQGIKVGFYESLYNNAHKGAAWRLGKPYYVDTNGEITDTDTDTFYQNPHGIEKVESRKTDLKNGTVYYENATDKFYTKGGYIKPYIGWGTNVSIGEHGLRPYANFGLTFKNDKKADNWSNYTEVNGERIDVTSNVDAGYDFSYVKPQIGVGAWFDFAPKEGKTAVTTLGIEYDIDIFAYNSSFEGSGFSSDKVKGTIAWPGVLNNDGTNDVREAAYVNRKTKYLDRTVTTTDVAFDVDEISELRHQIIPTYILTGDPAENFSLGFSASLPIGINTLTSEKYSERHQVRNIEYNTDTDRNEYGTQITRNQFQSMSQKDFSLGLDLAIGASYKLIPDRFTIHAGVSARPFSFTNSVRTYKAPANKEIVTQKVTDGLGNVTTDNKTVENLNPADTDDWLVQSDTVEVDNVWDAFSGNITGGFTFYFNNKVALDLAARWGTDNFDIDISSVNVLLTFKF